jgi:hypothetical protein
MLEARMQSKKRLTLRKKPRPDGIYVIKIEGKVAWEGKNPERKFSSLLSENRDRNISIAWKAGQESIIV